MKNITQHTPLQSYDVEIKATVRKTITVEAGDEKSAAEQAHEEFSVANDGAVVVPLLGGHYEQETISIEMLQSQYPHLKLHSLKPQQR